MKIDFKELAEKAKVKVLVFAKRLNRKKVVAGGALGILALAVIFNLFLVTPEPLDDGKEGLEVALDLSDVSASVAEKEAEEALNAENDNDAFTEMALSRKLARDEAMEVLKEVAQSSTAVDTMKEDALNSIQQIANDIEAEANIEGLIMSKGFEECVAVVNGETASVIVKTDGLLDNEVAQISEIVYTQAGVHPDNLRIIESQ